MNGVSIRDLARILRGNLRLAAMPPLGGDLEPIGRVVIDSREVQPGDVFWGLAGAHHNGSQFAEEAFARGALGVVVSGRRLEPWPGKFSIEVEDSHWGLWQLARARRREFSGQVIAIAGSEGATVTSRMIDAVLAHSLTGIAAQVAANDPASLPLAMLDLDEETDYAVFELKAKSSGEISSQSHLCDPSIAVITSLAKCTTLTHQVPTAVASWEAELASAISPDGWLVRYADAGLISPMDSLSRAKQRWTGRDAKNDFVARRIECHDGQLSFDVDGTRLVVRSASRRDLPAALAAFAVGRLMGRGPDEIAEALLTYRGVIGHGQLLRARDRWLVYNFATHGPGSFVAALEQLRDCAAPGRRIVMTESNTFTDSDAQAIVQGCGADWLFVYGTQANDLANATREAGMPHGRAVPCSEITEAVRLIENIWEPGDAVLLHGGVPAELQTAVETLTQRKTAAKAA